MTEISFASGAEIRRQLSSSVAARENLDQDHVSRETAALIYLNLRGVNSFGSIRFWRWARAHVPW